MQNEDIKWASLTCNNNVSNWGFSNKESGVSNPNAQFGLLYNPKDVKMLNVDSFNIPSQQFTNRKQDYSFYDSEKNKPLS